MWASGYSDLMGVELPSSVVARCYTDVGVYTSDLADCEASEPLPDFNQCSRGDSGSVHGTAVAEAVIDIAPDATLYISQPGSWGDLQATAQWMADQGVQVINYSVGWTHYGSRGDGTSPYSSSPLNTVDQAVDNGIVWVNAAGNSAQDTWFGSFSDSDGDGVMSFNSSGDQRNPIRLIECQRYVFQLRWDDSWGGADTDLDMFLWDESTGSILDIPAGWGFVGSAYEQSGASDHEPFEFFSLRAPIDSEDVGIFIVHRSGPEPDWIQLEMLLGRGGLEIHTSSGSITNPAESANPGMLAVGAAPFYDTDSIEPFSSQGPTPDRRTKPDIVGVDCAESVIYEFYTRSDNGRGCWFAGTSQASPHVAGLATLVRQRFPDYTAEQVANYLKHTADQRGTALNNTWGHGFAELPANEVENPSIPLLMTDSNDSCVATFSGDGLAVGKWEPACSSQARSGRYARYYSFSLAEESAVTITMESSVDPYLYLRSGDRSGLVVARNDDHGTLDGTVACAGSEGLSDLDSCITVEALSAGTYTIEATTYYPAERGVFSLNLSGAGSRSTTPSMGGETGDACVEAISGDGTTSGTWSSGCQSEESDRGYARYYSFSLVEESAVTITLESSVDPYLYLRSGDRSGLVVARNDDHGTLDGTVSCAGSEGLSVRDSCITVETLAAGNYTIEATTYSEDQEGSFTLTVSGLGGTPQ